MVTKYVKPRRRVVTPDDLNKWVESQTYGLVLNFVQELQESVAGLTNDSEVFVSDTSKELLNILDDVNEVIKSNPVVLEKDISRFGKVEFRDFYDHLSNKAPNLLSPLIQGKYKDESPIVELATYFNESWGNRTRIDYGSGHELNFISFLLCLERLELVKKVDYPCLILKVFTKYISTMRTLQRTYWLEPAGSHGVWGLDDYHFLPFLFGAAQLSTHPHMKPKSIHNEELVELYYKQYMYFECIYFINNIKTIPQNQDQKLSLRWHSPMLDDISSAKSWLKIKEGMIKMYKAEVLGKLPIVQHVMFGTLIPCPEGISEAHDHEDNECGHSHSPALIDTWGDCCGIKIPSAIAASESLKFDEKSRHKPIPFD